MPDYSLNTFLRRLRVSVLLPKGKEVTDAHLLRLFIEERDEAAFEALVRQHGPMVLSLCRRVLTNTQDIEDAFQASFLVLARKAASIRPRSQVGAWLHGVAQRVAFKARAASSRRQTRERQGTAFREPATASLAESTLEIARLVDVELERLPAKYRAVLVLCDLEGKSQPEAARQLGCPVGTVSSRRVRGRALLAKRLARQGVTLTAAALAALCAQPAATAPLPLALVNTTVRAAALLAAGSAAAGVASAPVVSLMEGALKSMLLMKLKATVLAVTMVAMIGAGAGGVILSSQVGPEMRPAEKERPTMEVAWQGKEEESKGEKGKKPRLDAYGDPIPDAAFARLGTVRLRHAGWSGNGVFSSDSKFLLTRGGDDLVRVWDVTAGKQIGSWQIGNDALGQKVASGQNSMAMALSSDDKTVAIGIRDGISLWDLESKKTLGLLKSPPPASLTFEPDGKTLISGGHEGDGTVRIWDLATQAEIHTLPLHKREVSHLFVTPDGKTLVSASALEGRVAVTDILSGDEVHPAEKVGTSIPLHFVILSGDGKLLYVWGIRGKKGGPPVPTFYVYDVQSGKVVRTANELQTMDPRVDAGALSADNKTLVFNDRAGVIHFWDLITGKELYKWPAPVRIHRLVFSPDGRTLLGYGQTPMIYLWDVTTGKRLHEDDGSQDYPSTLAFSRNGQMLVSTYQVEKSIRIWDVASTKVTSTISGHLGPYARTRNALFLPDGSAVISAAWIGDDALRLWDVKTAKEIRSFPLRGTSETDEFGASFGLQVECLSVSADGKDIFYSNGGSPGLGAVSQLGAFELTTGREILYREKEGGHAFSSDGRYLLDAQTFTSLELREVASGRIIWKQDGSFAPPFAFSPDAKLVASRLIKRMPQDNPPDSSPHIGLFQTITGKKVMEIPFSTEISVASIAFSPDGRTLTGIGDQGVSSWEIATGKECWHLPHADVRFSSICFTPDGRTLASGMNDGTILFLDLTGLAPDGQWTQRDATAAELDRYFKDLAGDDAAQAYKSMWSLVAARQSVSFLAERLKPVPAPDEKRISQLLADLDNEQFAVRSKATQELQKVGEVAVPLAKKALANNPSSEAKQRLEALVKEVEGRSFTTEELQVLRAIEALEHIGTPEARQLLATLAAGFEGARLTQEAKASVERLARRR